VEKLIDRLSLAEILGVLAPGFIMLVVLRAWLKWDLTEVLGPQVAENDLLLTATWLAVAYGMGMLLLEWVNVGTQMFMRLHLEAIASGANPLAVRIALPRRCLFLVTRILHGMPLPRIGLSFVEAQVMMSEFNESNSHVFELSRISSPWDRLDLFRKLIPRLEIPGSGPVLQAAAKVHSHLLYALCLSLTLTLVASGALIDVAIVLFQSGSVSKWIAVALLCGSASYCLRFAAARCWETETALVCSLAQWRDTR
jgi:hypothetical protein